MDTRTFIQVVTLAIIAWFAVGTWINVYVKGRYGTHRDDTDRNARG